MTQRICLDGATLSIDDVVRIARADAQVEIAGATGGGGGGGAMSAGWLAGLAAATLALARLRRREASSARD